MTAVSVLIGGFGGSKAGYEPLRAALETESGNPFIFTSFTRWRYWWVPRRSRRYPRCLWRQAVHVARQMQQQDIHAARVYAHSMGGDVAMILADAFPELVCEAILLNSAGLHVDGLFGLAVRFSRKVLQDARDARHHPDPQVREIIRTSKWGAVRYLLNPLRSFAESVTISRFRAYQWLYPLLRQKQIPVPVCHSTSDSVFLHEPVRRAVKFRCGRLVSLGNLPHDVQYYPEKTAAALAAADLL